jgi:hypothetical protein
MQKIKNHANIFGHYICFKYLTMKKVSFILLIFASS